MIGQTETQAPAPAPDAAKQTAAAPDKTSPSFFRRFDFGLRIRGTKDDFFYDKKTLDTTTVKPASTNNFTTTLTQHHVGLGPTVSFLVNKHLLLSVDLIYQKVEYAQTEKITLTSNSAVTNITESTHASYWDLPFQARVFSVIPHQPRRMFLTAGGVIRDVRNVKSGTSFTYPDLTTSYNETPTRPAHSTAKGISGGFGFRFADDYGIKITPEVRYTHFMSAIFDSNSTRSRPDALEIMIGISF